MTPEQPSAEVHLDRSLRFRAAWRWHFYAAWFVLPILVTLAATGFIILLKPTIERWAYGDMLYLDSVVTEPLPTAQLIDSVWLTHPDAIIDSVVPPRDAGRATQIDITDIEGRSLSVYVNPETADVLGHIDNATRIDYVATQIHGTLWMGRWGDYLVEMAGGWAVIMALTGTYLWWPRRRRTALRTEFPIESHGASHTGPSRRKVPRSVHRRSGMLLAPVLVYLVVTGLPWSGFWGEEIWGTVLERSGAGYETPPEPRSNHVALGDQHTAGFPVTWATKRTVIPTSTTDFGAQVALSEPLSVDEIAAIARDNGMLPGFSIALPWDEVGVYSVVNAWPSPAQDERTLHIDQYSGEVVQELGWNTTYGSLARATVWGVNSHMGRQLGVVNGFILGVACVAAIVSSLSAMAMYWRRRPRRTLGFPRRPVDVRLTRAVIVTAIVLGTVMPLLGLSILLVLAIDRWVVREVPPLRTAFGMHDR
ncbi:MAG: PepSY-associated TM helix domain-containing protein [Ilumatobacteraceae bacterium]